MPPPALAGVAMRSRVTLQISRTPQRKYFNCRGVSEIRIKVRGYGRIALERNGNRNQREEKGAPYNDQERGLPIFI